MQLLAVGDRLYPGNSPRPVLDATARNILLPRIRSVLEDVRPRPRETEVLDGGDRLTVHVHPIHGAFSGQVLAVLGCYAPVDTPVPEKPLVGSWEWRVMPPGPGQEMRTFWNRELWDVYGIKRPERPDGSPDWAFDWWDGPQWLDEVVVDSDRVGMRQVLDNALKAEADDLFRFTFRSRSPQTGEIHRLRLAGRSYVADAETPPFWFRGTTMRIDHVPEPYLESPSGEKAFIDAIFAVSRDPLFAIDTTYEHIYLTSRSFATLDVSLPPHRHLPALCHPEDLPAVRAMLATATQDPGTPVGPVTVRLTANPGWRLLELTGTGVRLADGEPHHVLCRARRAAAD